MAAWAFFIAVQLRGGLALPLRLAASAKANPHTVQWISTQASTILAFFSTLLFSWGVRRSITLHLRKDGMSLAICVSFVKISSRWFILNPMKPKCSLMAIVIIILTGLIALNLIVHFTQAESLNNASALLREMQKNTALNECVWNGASRPAFIVGQSESGYAAVKGDLSFPATFNLIDQAFSRSTGGILSLTLSPLNSSTWFRSTKTLQTTIKPEWDIPRSLTSSYLLIQQGFTADVSCKLWDPAGATMPPISIRNTTVEAWNDTTVGTSDIYFATMHSDCANPQFLNWTEAYTLIDQPNYLSMIACPSQNDYSAGQDGLYQSMKTIVCSLSPKITNDSVIDVAIATQSSGVVADISGPATFSAVTALHDMVYFSQAIVSNSIGYKVRALLEEVDGYTITDNTTLRTTEEYIRRVTKYSASLRTPCLSSRTEFLDALPSTMNVSTGEMFRSETIGWIPAAPVTILELLPGTVVAVLTIYCVVMAIWQHAGDPEGEDFYPSDPMHLVAASAAGGLTDVLIGMKEEDIRPTGGINVSLGTTTKRRAAFIANRTI
ncbi:hypothetical protein DFH08DRAFT_1011667 [Mycena albidolilacea]|uniref:Uncharacterized protein n=1 Tax=Mycena albidolilacea TaxID=1033008 RepID=A0AAD6ZXY4_9AGAR|nr:hypothetical protein DFH08DRAFT_1011667 [Mycena albidolilacea]